ASLSSLTYSLGGQSFSPAISLRQPLSGDLSLYQQVQEEALKRNNDIHPWN
ncbi:unnamed protein product, partial [Brassica rapa subsp. narinosa]